MRGLVAARKNPFALVLENFFDDFV